MPRRRPAHRARARGPAWWRPPHGRSLRIEPAHPRASRAAASVSWYGRTSYTLLSPSSAPMTHHRDARETTRWREHEKREPGRPGLPFWLVPASEPRIALVGNPDDCPMLFGCGHNLLYRAEFAAELALVESHAALDEREEGVILADADIGAGVEFGAALTHEDVARNGDFATELLHAKTTTGRITTVARRTACLLMCHCLNSSGLRLRRPRGRRQRRWSWRRPSSARPSSFPRRRSGSSGS